MKVLLGRVLDQLIDRSDSREVLGISPDWHPGLTDGYFIDMRTKTVELPRDESARETAVRAGIPVQICQWGIGFYQEWQGGKREDELRWFMKCADTLVESQEREGRFAGCWLHTVASPYRTPVPWVSAMAQGEALSVLLRAHALAPASGEYEAAAKLAAKSFHRPLEEGGVLTCDGEGVVCLEEYPSSPPSRVLNGWVFAWMGLNEYAEAFRDQEANALADRSLKGLLTMLPRYDTGYWSTYDLFPGFAIRFHANRFYHRLHIAQLEAMFRITGESLFRTHAERWMDYMSSPSCRRRYAAHRLCFKAYCCLTGW